jgi:hypothetical protein
MHYMKSELTATHPQQDFRTIFWSVVASSALFLLGDHLPISRLRHKRALRRVARLRARPRGTRRGPAQYRRRVLRPGDGGRETRAPRPAERRMNRTGAGIPAEPEPRGRPRPSRSPLPFGKRNTPPSANTAPAPAPGLHGARACAEAPAHSEVSSPSCDSRPTATISKSSSAGNRRAGDAAPRSGVPPHEPGRPEPVLLFLLSVDEPAFL